MDPVVTEMLGGEFLDEGNPSAPLASPFLGSGFLADTAAPSAQREVPMPGLVSPFTEAFAGGGSEDEQLLEELLGELQDEAFEEAVEALVDEAAALQLSSPWSSESASGTALEGCCVRRGASMIPEFLQTLIAPEASETAPVLHLFGGPFVTFERRRFDVPEGSKRLLVFVALHRSRVERRYAAGSLWPVGDDLRAAGNLRSALWRLNCAGIRLLSADKHGLTMRDNVLVDAHLVSSWAARLLASICFLAGMTTGC